METRYLNLELVQSDWKDLVLQWNDSICIVLRARGRDSARSSVASAMLRDVEQADLVEYGLIPEFVGRFPIICNLEVPGCILSVHNLQILASLLPSVKANWL